MKTRRTIYLVVGWLLIVINCLGILADLKEIQSKFSDPAYGIGYFIGGRISLFIGCIFLYAAARIKKKMREKEQRELEESFLSK